MSTKQDLSASRLYPDLLGVVNPLPNTEAVLFIDALLGRDKSGLERDAQPVWVTIGMDVSKRPGFESMFRPGLYRGDQGIRSFVQWLDANSVDLLQLCDIVKKAGYPDEAQAVLDHLARERSS